MKVSAASNAGSSGMDNESTPARVNWMKSQTLVDPRLLLSNNPRVKALLAPFDTTSPKRIRADMRAKFAEAVDKVNNHLLRSIHYSGLSFRMHESSGRFYAVMTDKKSGEVVRTMPALDLLEIAGRLRYFVGTMINKQG